MDENTINQEDIVSVTPIRLDVLKVEFAKRKLCNCFRPKYELDYQNRLVWCLECGAIVDPIEALRKIAWQHEEINRTHERMLEEREAVANYKPHLRVIKELERHYRQGNERNKMVPTCPHCYEPFDLSDLISNTWINRRFLDE